MKAYKPSLEQLELLIETDNRWAGFSDEIKNAALKFMAMLLMQIVSQTDSNRPNYKLEDSHAR